MATETPEVVYMRPSGKKKTPPPISRIAWGPQSQAIQVTFPTGTYRYANVTPLIWRELKAAPVLWRAVQKVIVGHPRAHPYELLTDAKEIWR